MSELPDIQENNEQILNDIQSLQEMEQKLFNSLETTPNLTIDEQQKIIEKMNQLSTMRINLYQTLSGVNNYFENALNSSVGSLKEQAIAIEIVENELNRAKKRLEILEQERNNKIRLVEINTYFGDKYAEHSQLMKIIIFTLVPVIILAILNNKGILPNMVYYILIAIVSFIGGFYFWRRFASIIMRDNMNYQEYEFAFNPNSLPTDSSSSSSDPWASDSNYGTCIGDTCCSPGLVYDIRLNQCVVMSSSATTESSSTTESFVESMINDVLSKTQPGNYKTSYDLKSNIEAYNSR